MPGPENQNPTVRVKRRDARVTIDMPPAERAALGAGGTDVNLRARLNYSDAQLLAECVVHTYRASGPGGQKRNKTSSAVRLHHRPSGLIVVAAESRSQHENKARALRRLREALAVTARVTPPVDIHWPTGIQVVAGCLHVGHKNPALWHVLALVLDVFAAHAGRLSDAAAQLGVTSSSLTRFLREHPRAWAEASRIRQQAGLPPLRA